MLYNRIDIKARVVYDIFQICVYHKYKGNARYLYVDVLCFKGESKAMLNNSFVRNIRKVMLVFSFILILWLSGSACSQNSVTQQKASGALLAQIALRQQQIDKPTVERQSQMQQMGMQTANLNVQRIFIYLEQKLTANQAVELTALGINLYMDSWIPPVGNHSDGFMLADMPVDKLDTLAAKNYVIKLDTAEIEAQPQMMTPQ